MENGIKTRNPSRAEVATILNIWDKLKGEYGGEEWTGILLAMREVHTAFGFGHKGLDYAIATRRGRGASARERGEDRESLAYFAQRVIDGQDALEAWEDATNGIPPLEGVKRLSEAQSAIGTETRCTACGRPLESLDLVSGTGGPNDRAKSPHGGATDVQEGV